MTSFRVTFFHLGVFGTVSVDWRLKSFTISPKQDISLPSTTHVTFAPNEKRTSFTAFINADDVPEANEYFVIELYDALGGAQIDSSYQNINLTIYANDNAGGMINFQTDSLSARVEEGDVIILKLQRTLPALGNAIIMWEVLGLNAGVDFKEVLGTIEFKSVSGPM